MRIRGEQPDDVDAIRAVHDSAFEADALVDRLRSVTQVTLSDPSTVRIVGLAPVAVVPERQRQGIGSALVRAGFAACAHSGVDTVVLVGHATYDPRFGFTPASRFSLRCEHGVPDEVFRAVELRSCALTGSGETVRHHAVFRELGIRSPGRLRRTV